MTDDSEDRPAPRKYSRTTDSKNPIVRIVGNGGGLVLTRIMVIVGFPAISALAAYAFDLTLQKFETAIHDVAKEVHEVADAVKDVKSDVKTTQDQVNGLRTDVAVLQVQQSDISARINKGK